MTTTWVKHHRNLLFNEGLTPGSFSNISPNAKVQSK